MSLFFRLGEEVSLVATVFNNFPLDVSALLLLQDSEQFSFVLLPDERISQEGQHPDIELTELKSLLCNSYSSTEEGYRFVNNFPISRDNSEMKGY
jgi:hypothetical protein